MTLDPVARFWSTFDDARPLADLRAELELLLADLPEPRRVFERASLLDAVGDEAGAVDLYEQALAEGLVSPFREQAVIQLASSLRSIGRPGEAEPLLRGLLEHGEVGPAAAAFLALVLHDLGRSREALRVSLRASRASAALPPVGRGVSPTAHREAETAKAHRG